MYMQIETCNIQELYGNDDWIFFKPAQPLKVFFVYIFHLLCADLISTLKNQGRLQMTYYHEQRRCGIKGFGQKLKS